VVRKTTAKGEAARSGPTTDCIVVVAGADSIGFSLERSDSDFWKSLMPCESFGQGFLLASSFVSDWPQWAGFAGLQQSCVDGSTAAGAHLRQTPQATVIVREKQTHTWSNLRAIPYT